MSSFGAREELLRWIDQRRAAAESERQEVRERGRFVEDPIGAAIQLLDLAQRLQGWPIPVDRTTARQATASLESWNRLRRALRPR